MRYTARRLRRFALRLQKNLSRIFLEEIDFSDLHALGSRVGFQLFGCTYALLAADPAETDYA
jgi:hypothetical protein